MTVKTESFTMERPSLVTRIEKIYFPGDTVWFQGNSMIPLRTIWNWDTLSGKFLVPFK